MTLYQQINKLLETNPTLLPIIQNGEYYKIVGPTKDNYGNWRDSGWCSLIEEAKQDIGDFHGYTEEEWNECEQQGAKIIGYYQIEMKPFEVGDKVKVFESIKETEDWENELDLDEVYEISYIVNKTGGLFYNLNNGYLISHRFLIPAGDPLEKLDILIK